MTSRVHHAALGFDTSAPVYERARPSYPVAAVADVVDLLRIVPASTVVDVAAGTGKFTRLLVPTRASLVAIEPLAAMRAELTRVLPGVKVRNGTAEALPLPDESADAVTVAQAFHWFDGQRALVEIHRVLRPGGGLALLWNVRDRTAEWVDRLVEITEPYADAPRYRTGEWRLAFASTDRFTPLQDRRYGFTHEVDADTMVERISSISWIAVLPEAERASVLERVRRLFDDMPARFPVPYHTELWWCRAR